jgi:cobalt/nickel transport system permease protein
MQSFLLAGIQLLHVPDGFLNIPISVLCWIVTLIVLYFAVKQAQLDFDERLVPLAGIMAAFIFAGQMLNFPVAGGTSGHFIGATLAFVVLGPWVGVLAMTAVISLQALLFQDGGLVVMGANILIMGIVPGFLGYGMFQLVKNQSRKVKLGVTAVAAWLSVMLAALIAALLLGFSGTTSLAIAVPAMLGVHALIGLGEALITVAALSFIMQTRPQLLTDSAPAGSGKWIISGLILALVVVFFAPLASGSPDGLEWVAARSGFIETALAAPFNILPGYTIPGLGETAVSTILAGLIGALIVAGITFGLGRILRRQR